MLSVKVPIITLGVVLTTKTQENSRKLKKTQFQMDTGLDAVCFQTGAEALYKARRCPCP